MAPSWPAQSHHTPPVPGNPLPFQGPALCQLRGEVSSFAWLSTQLECVNTWRSAEWQKRSSCQVLHGEMKAAALQTRTQALVWLFMI